MATTSDGLSKGEISAVFTTLASSGDGWGNRAHQYLRVEYDTQECEWHTPALTLRFHSGSARIDAPYDTNVCLQIPILKRHPIPAPKNSAHRCDRFVGRR
jgi:hypothetical protein